MRRFYRAVDVDSDAEGFLIRLDGRVLKTPAKAELRLPTAAFAEALAEEWRRQGEKIDPETMPLMRVMATAIDRVGPRRADVITETAGYAHADLLCYRAPEPADLKSRQEAQWQPWLDWLQACHGISLKVTQGVVAIAQDRKMLAKITTLIGGQDDIRLTVLHLATAALGSVVLALALLNGEIGMEEAFALSQLDEAYQADRWGEDSEAAARRALLHREIADYARVLTLIN